MKILITGAEGLVGADVTEELRRRGHTAIGTCHRGENPGADCIRLDITDRAMVHRVIGRVRPEAVIHCAAWTAVDEAEDPQHIPQVRAVNADGTRNIAEACQAAGCKLLYFSTDYVFSGQGRDPWPADSTCFAPVNVYGQTKLAGEQAVTSLLSRYFIVRISWVFGANGKNFVSTMLRLAKSRDTLQVIDDQIGTPTYTRDLARLAADMIESDAYGIYHATNEGGYISWHGFACEIFRQAGYSINVIPVSTLEYGLSKAPRPYNSRLDKSKLAQSGFQPLPHWQSALSRYLQEIKESIWEKSP